MRTCQSWNLVPLGILCLFFADHNIVQSFTSPAFTTLRRHAFTVSSLINYVPTRCFLSNVPEEEEDIDIPENWNEDEILAEFEEIEKGPVEEEEEVVYAEEVEAPVVVDEDEEIDIDEEDLDEIDLDEEDEEVEEIEEEILGEVEWEEEDEDETTLDIAAANADVDVDDDDEEEGTFVGHDEDNPNYMQQKELIQKAIQAADQRARDENFDPVDFFQNQMTDEMRASLEDLPFLREIREKTQDLELTEADISGLDIEEEVEKAPDILADEPYPRDETGDFLSATIGPTLTDDDLEEFDQTYKSNVQTLSEEPWDKVMFKDMYGWENLSNETLEEMEACLEEISGSAYNVTRWLLYDLDFNVTNLILSAIQHNRNAPILLQHWYPQLVTYQRYQYVRDRNFDFTWDDVVAADITELQRYYAGFGYDEIPSKAPFETGIISFEDLDEEEIKMASFESWMKEVYNPEWDRKDFDDDDMQDEDNVFSEFYESPQHPDVPTIDDAIDDIESWREELGTDDDDDESVKAYRDMMGKVYEYKYVKDEAFEREFRGHLVIACSGLDEDLEVAERITLRFEEEFGKKVYVETRIMELARAEDNVFEVWLESYEIDLLHSKRRATSNTQDWKGPAVIDDTQLDYLVDKVRYLISDDARYSYRIELELQD